MPSHNKPLKPQQYPEDTQYFHGLEEKSDNTQGKTTTQVFIIEYKTLEFPSVNAVF